MKERPIIFSGPMVRAIREGRKTQTRRIVKPQPNDSWMLPDSKGYNPDWKNFFREDGKQLRWIKHPEKHAEIKPPVCPGDVLWVRETWADTNGENGPMISYRAGGDRFLVEESYPVDYSRYPGCQFTMWCGDLRRGAEGHVWRSPIHMPRWASRLRLLVKSVRVERLQDISQEDARAEGAEGGCVWCGVPNGTCDCERPRPDYRDGFVNVWHAIHGPNSWPSNPWVWVYEFGLQK